jgi:hypothetical protein
MYRGCDTIPIVVDINGKERNIESIKRMTHNVMDKDGNPISTEYVEVVIKGHMRNWTEWWPLVEFVKTNPTVKV